MRLVHTRQETGGVLYVWLHQGELRLRWRANPHPDGFVLPEIEDCERLGIAYKERRAPRVYATQSTLRVVGPRGSVEGPWPTDATSWFRFLLAVRSATLDSACLKSDGPMPKRKVLKQPGEDEAPFSRPMREHIEPAPYGSITRRALQLVRKRDNSHDE